MSTRQIKSAKKRVVDEEGNVFDLDMTVETTTVDSGFDKIWLGHLAVVLDLLGSSKIKVLGFLLENRNYENRVIATQKKIAEELGISRRTVMETLKSLREADAVRMEQSGVYRLNPAIVFKGSKGGRMRLLFEYRSVEDSEVRSTQFGQSAVRQTPGEDDTAAAE